MKNVSISLIVMIWSLFLFFYSYKEKKNMLGYKSFQLGLHECVWSWTNRCFGGWMFIGSIVYLVIAVIQKINGNSFSRVLLFGGLLYLLIGIVVTECYAWWKRMHKEQ